MYTSEHTRGSQLIPPREGCCRQVHATSRIEDFPSGPPEYLMSYETRQKTSGLLLVMKAGRGRGEMREQRQISAHSAHSKTSCWRALSHRTEELRPVCRSSSAMSCLTNPDAHKTCERHTL